MEQIKQAFSKVKEDINRIEQEIESLKLKINKITDEFPALISLIQEVSNEIKQKKPDENTKTQNPTHFPTIQHINPTQNIEIPTDNQNPTQNPTDDLPLKAVKSQYNDVSIGNRGVPTDNPTNKPTNKPTDNPTHFPTDKVRFNDEVSSRKTRESMEKASEILASLDTIKKEIRLKFKRLTKKELLVFSHLYQLEEEGREVNYHLIASEMNISESSIREYIKHLINKGIPISKEKINNKKILLHISPDLKKIATLDTILRLREL
ncbi:PT domain-containing protein [Candidatus Pacearchaeota archaeon]|nr:PT domain-containing protein [Candidatus Pacearchaeota archaeon]